MVKEDDMDNERILIVFEEDIKRKKTKLVDSSIVERNLISSEDESMENGHGNDGIIEFDKIPLSKNIYSLECLIQMETKNKL